MDLELRFDYNKLNLKNQESFIPKRLISNYVIESLDYVVDEIIVQRFDFQLLDNIYDVNDVGEYGEYVYNIINASTTIANKNTYFKINSMNSTNALMIAEPSNNECSFIQHKTQEYGLFNGGTNIKIQTKQFYIIGLCMSNVTNITLLDIDISLSHVKNNTYTYDISNYDLSLDYNCKITVNKPHIITIVNTIENILFIEDDCIINNITANNIIMPINYLTPIFGNFAVAKLDLIKIPKKSNFAENIKPINKILSLDTICPIKSESINTNNHYMECTICKNAYCYNEINKWLKINKSCPMCRNNWKNNIIYKNC